MCVCVLLRRTKSVAPGFSLVVNTVRMDMARSTMIDPPGDEIQDPVHRNTRSGKCTECNLGKKGKYIKAQQ